MRTKIIFSLCFQACCMRCCGLAWRSVWQCRNSIWEPTNPFYSSIMFVIEESMSFILFQPDYPSHLSSNKEYEIRLGVHTEQKWLFNIAANMIFTNLISDPCINIFTESVSFGQPSGTILYQIKSSQWTEWHQQFFHLQNVSQSNDN